MRPLYRACRHTHIVSLLSNGIFRFIQLLWNGKRLRRTGQIHSACFRSGCHGVGEMICVAMVFSSILHHALREYDTSIPDYTPPYINSTGEAISGGAISGGAINQAAGPPHPNFLLIYDRPLKRDSTISPAVIFPLLSRVAHTTRPRGRVGEEQERRPRAGTEGYWSGALREEWYDDQASRVERSWSDTTMVLSNVKSRLQCQGE